MQNFVRIRYCSLQLRKRHIDNVDILLSILNN